MRAHADQGFALPLALIGALAVLLSASSVMAMALGSRQQLQLELLLALSLGLVLSAVALQSLLADGQRSQRLGQQFHQRSEQRRLLALIEAMHWRPLRSQRIPIPNSASVQWLAVSRCCS